MAILDAIKDFGRIAKASKLNNMFLQSFAEVVEMKESQEGLDYISPSETNMILKQLDVLIALVNQVNLKKDNQIVLMQGIKSFIRDGKTKKKAYKLLSEIVGKF